MVTAQLKTKTYPPNNKQKPQGNKIRGWRAGSVVESICCPYREPGFGFQYPPQTAPNAVPRFRGSNTFFWPWVFVHMCTYKQVSTDTHKTKGKKKKKKNPCQTLPKTLPIKPHKPEFCVNHPEVRKPHPTVGSWLNHCIRAANYKLSLKSWFRRMANVHHLVSKLSHCKQNMAKPRF